MDKHERIVKHREAQRRYIHNLRALNIPIPRNNLLKKKIWRSRNPWLKHLYSARTRCTNKNHISYKRYGGKGIKLFLTAIEIKILWNRDNADLLKIPSLDRINNKGNYEFNNCRFIELSSNSSHKGSANGSSKFIENDILRIRKEYSSGISIELLCKKYKVTRPCIFGIINRLRWRHL